MEATSSSETSKQTHRPVWRHKTRRLSTGF